MIEFNYQVYNMNNNIKNDYYLNLLIISNINQIYI